MSSIRHEDFEDPPLKMRIDYRKCARSGQCFYMYPDLVQKGDDDLPRLLNHEVPMEKRGRAEELIDICPMAAIHAEASGVDP